MAGEFDGETVISLGAVEAWGTSPQIAILGLSKPSGVDNNDKSKQ